MSIGPESGGLEVLAALLERELEGFRQFQRILENEQAALLGNRIEDLMPLAQRKQAMVVTLTRLADERNAVLSREVGATNQLGMAAWLARFDPTDRAGVGARWEALVGLARSAKELNRLNGQVINTQLAHNQQALQVLMGANATTAHLYGRDGQAYSTAPSTGGRPLGKA